MMHFVRTFRRKTYIAIEEIRLCGKVVAYTSKTFKKMVDEKMHKLPLILPPLTRPWP